MMVLFLASKAALFCNGCMARLAISGCLLTTVSMSQKDMLEDHKRTGAYFNAVMQNKRQFHDKVVLDVGTGSGILAIFAAMAGAKKVYAVEATNMAKNARNLVDHNKVRSRSTIHESLGLLLCT